MSYPPPTLIPRKSRASGVRRAVFVGTLGLLVATCAVTRMTHSSEKADMGPLADAPLSPPPGSPAPKVAEAAPAPAAEPAPAPVAMAAPAAAPVVAPAAVVPAAPAPDARQPDHWYYVPQIGDGPGAIYSRTGGGWDYAFACTLATRTIEFIAVNTGDPGTFDRQYMRVGHARLMLDATYSKEGHGTISTKLPAKHPFFDAFVGTGKSIELELLEGKTVVIPVGSEVTRLIRDCRGNGEAAKSADVATAGR